jgi:hypothetical protein
MCSVKARVFLKGAKILALKTSNGSMGIWCISQDQIQVTKSGSPPCGAMESRWAIGALVNHKDKIKNNTKIPRQIIL